MKSIHNEVVSLGVDVCVIGNGTSLMAKDFAAQFDLPYPVYTDPSKQSYKFMDFKRSFGLRLSSVFHAGRAIRKGHAQGATKGDVWQQGGEGLFARGGQLLWQHAAKNAGEHASREQVLMAIHSHLSKNSHRMGSK